MKAKLNNNDFCRAAKKLKCEVAAIKAVANTESAGNGFYTDGFPVILFERHLFRKFTDGKYNKTHPHLSGPAGNYGKPGQNQRNKFNEAFELDPEAAMKSCSWGKFQILGSNFKVCGFTSVGAFVDAMKESEGRHLDGFVSFVIGNKLDDELRRHNWAGFARGYNGAGYKKNKYDTKMATAYAKFLKENINCDGVKPEDTNKVTDTVVENNTDNSVSVEVKQDGSVKVETNQYSTPPEKVAVVAAKPESVFSKMYTKIAGALVGNTLFSSVLSYFQSLTGITVDPVVFGIVIGLVILFTLIWLVYELVQKSKTKKIQRELDELLVKENSTATNTVQIIPSDEAALYRAKGYKIITRGESVPGLPVVTESQQNNSNSLSIIQ